MLEPTYSLALFVLCAILSFIYSPIDTANSNLSTPSLYFNNKYNYFQRYLVISNLLYNSNWSDLIALSKFQTNHSLQKTKLQFVIRNAGENDGIHIRGSECDQKILSKKESTGFVLSPNYPYPYIPKTVCR